MTPASDPTNKYRSKEKRAAYNDTLHCAHRLSRIDAPYILELTTAYIQNVHHLPLADAKQVAAKALRVERGRRIAAKQKEQAQ